VVAGGGQKGKANPFRVPILIFFNPLTSKGFVSNISL